MINFLTKGILRDRSRSLFPILIVSIMVAIIVFFKGFVMGIMNQLFLSTATVNSGHVKIITAEYKKEHQLLPNDLALIDVEELTNEISKDYPEYFWTPRITFAGLLDVPNVNGETISQGPTIALGLDLLSNNSRQIDLWELEKKLIKGKLPKQSNEALISQKLANSLNIHIGEIVTYIGSTMHGGFTTYNFIIVGTFNLMMGSADRNMMLVDISGARQALDMDNAASEILGYKHSLIYDDNEAVLLANQFNTTHQENSDIFKPVMVALRDTNQMGTIVDLNNAIMSILLGCFMAINMIVLWNMGLMNGLRRYGEFGMRLAIGESKGHVFRSMVIESAIIGTIGTIIGTIIGLGITFYLQNVGIDYSDALEQLNSSNIIMPNIMRAHVTPDLYYIGFFPGVIATILGTMLAGRAIYSREMSQLFKELET